MACLSFVKHIAQVPCNRYNTAFVNQKKLFFPSLLLAYSYDTGGKLSKKTTTCHKRYPFSWRSHSYMTQPIISSAKYIIKSAFFNLFFKFRKQNIESHSISAFLKPTFQILINQRFPLVTHALQQFHWPTAASGVLPRRVTLDPII